MGLMQFIGNRHFERQVEQGKVTFDHTGKMLDVRHIRTEKLPVHMKNLLDHNANDAVEEKPKKLHIKKNQKKNDKKPKEEENENAGMYQSFK